MNDIINDTDNSRQTFVRLAGVMLVICAAIALGGCFGSWHTGMWLFGAVVGAGLAELRLALLYMAIVKSVMLDKDKASLYIRGQYNVRLLLTVAVIVAAFLLKAYINPWGVLICQLSMQPAVYLTKLIFGKRGE